MQEDKEVIELSVKQSGIVEEKDISDLYKEVMSDIRQDRDEIEQAYNNFCEMVFNDGDCSSASKEALVNLLKLKTETSDKKSRVMELLLKARKDSTPRLDVKANHAEFNIDNHRKFLREISDSEKKNP